MHTSPTPTHRGEQSAAILLESLLDKYAAEVDYTTLLALYRKVVFFCWNVQALRDGVLNER